jgi:hypothetical protein
MDWSAGECEKGEILKLNKKKKAGRKRRCP